MLPDGHLPWRSGVLSTDSSCQPQLGSHPAGLTQAEVVGPSPAPARGTARSREKGCGAEDRRG